MTTLTGPVAITDLQEFMGTGNVVSLSYRFPVQGVITILSIDALVLALVHSMGKEEYLLLAIEYLHHM